MKKILIVLIIVFFTITACEAVFIEDISNEKVSLIAPSNGVELLINELNFNWNAVEDAKNYQLQIVTPNFENSSQIILDTIIDQITFKKELIIGVYEWRVKAINGEYHTDFTTNAFTIK